MKYFKQHDGIEGSKDKGGGGGGGFTEAPNTLRSLAVVRVLEAISEGPIVGLATGDAQSIYFDDTQVQNEDSSFNFNAVSYDTRVGLPSQPYMPGFPAVESIVGVGTNLTFGHPVVKGVSSANIDAVRVTINLINGLSLQDTTNGSLNGTSVTIAIDRQVEGTGVWEEVIVPTITGKTMTPYEVDWRIERPLNSTGQLWNIRVRRITADATSSAVKDLTQFARFTEIQDVKLEYDYTAYVGIAVDAQSTGGKIPVRSYLVKGLIVSVPSNYDPEARTYTGQWNGTFKQAWTDNPAWVLYDLLTNVRYGMGEFVTPAMIDKFSFYDAAVYNDQLVPDGRGGLEPRFTFNYVINQQQDALKLIQAIAGSMRATAIYSGGLIWINQDRPSDPVKLVTKANVIDGRFTYTSTPLLQRHTVARVTYNDKSDRYMPAVTTVESGEIARYGYNPTDVAAYGAVTEGQAIRHGKWILDTELTTTELVTYKSSFNQFDLQIGDVIKLFDEDYTQTSGAGRIIDVGTSSFTLDRPVTLGPTSTIDVLDNDGKTIHTYNILDANGTFTTVTISEPLATFTPQANDYIITSTVAPRLFRVMEVKFEAENEISVKAAFYDPGKYARVEEGIISVPAIYSKTDVNKCGVVSDLTATPEGYVDPVLGPQVALRIDWTAPTTEGVIGYEVRYNKNSGAFSPLQVTSQPSFTIYSADQGVYEVQVIAFNIRNVRSTPVVATFAHGYSGNCTLNPPLSVALASGHGTGTTWAGTDLYVQWTPDPANATVAGESVGGYRIKITNADTSTLVRTVDVDQNTTSFDYTLSDNTKDNVNPARNVRIDVFTLDAYSRPSSTGAFETFYNPSPSAPTNVNVIGTVAGAKVTCDKPTDSDYLGFMVWGSTTDNFTPSASNLLFEGDASVVSLTGLPPGTTYYFRVAAYDVFDKSYAGTGMNLSPQHSATTLSAGGGVPAVATLPGTATEGDVAMLTSDGKLYRYHSGAWSSAVPAIDVTGQIVGSQIENGAVTTSKIAAGAVTANEIAANTISADKLVANSITAAELATSTLITTSAQLGTAVINTAAIQDAAINSAKISDVSADIITTGTLSAGTQISVGDTVLIDGGNSLISTTSANTKTVMSSGNVMTYTNVGGTWYPYQMLSHVETGQANNNTLVTIPGYFAVQPRVLVTPASLALYNPTYSTQGQSIVCTAGSITETSTGSKIWQFTPTATLNLAANTGSAAINVGSGDTSANSWTSAAYTTPANCASITPSVNLLSNRGTGTGSYYYRSCRWRIEYYSGSAWVTTDSFKVANMGAQTSTPVVDTKTLTFPSAGTWQWRIYVENYDTDGTTFGSTSYTYSQETVTAANVSATQSTQGSTTFGSTFSSPSGSGEIYEIDFSWQYRVQIHYTSFLNGKGLGTGGGATWSDFQSGGVTYPTYSGISRTSGTQSADVDYTSPVDTRVVTGSNLIFDTTSLFARADMTRYFYGTYYYSCQTTVTLQNQSAVIKRRTIVPNSTTPSNNTLINSYGFSLTSAQVLATGTLNWLAIGQ